MAFMVRTSSFPGGGDGPATLPDGSRRPDLSAVLAGVELPVGAAAGLFHPRRVVLVPPHRLGQAALPRLRRPPAQLALDLARVDRVAAVVAGPVLHEADQGARLAQGPQQ